MCSSYFQGNNTLILDIKQDIWLIFALKSFCFFKPHAIICSSSSTLFLLLFWGVLILSSKTQQNSDFHFGCNKTLPQRRKNYVLFLLVCIETHITAIIFLTIVCIDHSFECCANLCNFRANKLQNHNVWCGRVSTCYNWIIILVRSLCYRPGRATASHTQKYANNLAANSLTPEHSVREQTGCLQFAWSCNG